MRILVFIGLLFTISAPSEGVESTFERRNRHLRRKAKVAPTLSLSQLLVKSEELTKKFERQAAELREKVHTTEQDIPTEPDVDEGSDVEATFLEVGERKPGVADEGLRAMEAVNEEILRYTDHMRKLGNEASLFYRK